MLPKNRRVDKSLFVEVLKKGESFYSKNISLRVLKKENLENSRFSFVVPKKTEKSAVVRNLLRRRGYSVLNSVLKDIKSSFISVFFLKKGSEKLSFKDLQEEIVFLLKRSNILLK